MKKWALILLGALASSIALAADSIVLYAPTRSIKDQGITTKGWGSGSIAETDETAYEGLNSLRVSTRNYFQGGRILLSKPVDLSAAAADPNNLLLIVLKTADSSQTLGGGTSGGPGRGAGGGGAEGGAGGSSGGAVVDGDGGGGGTRGGGGARTGGGGGMTGGGGTTGTKIDAVALDQIRLIVTTTDGMKSEVYVPMKGAPGKDGWRNISVPISALPGLAKTNKQIKEVAFSGNSVGTFYIGEIRTVNDPTPISGEPNIREANIGLNEEVQFIGSGYGGSTILRYTWDFDSADGIQEEAEGPFVKRRFRKTGVYTVTLTIHDSYGLKKPYSTTITIKVN